MPEYTGNNHVKPWMIETYNNNIRYDLQQKTSALEGSVLVDGGVKGERKRYQSIEANDDLNVINRAWAIEGGKFKDDAQNTVLNTNQVSSRWLDTTPYARAEFIDQEDIVELLTDPTSYIVQSTIMACKRKKDKIILDGILADVDGVKMDGTKKVIAFDPKQVVDSKLSADGSVAEGETGMNLKKLLSCKYIMDKENVPAEGRTFVISALQLQELLSMEETTSSLYNEVRALVHGEINTFLGFNFVRTELIKDAGGSGTGVANCYAYVKNAIQLGVVKDIGTKIQDVPMLNFNTVIQTRFRMGCIRMFENGVVKIPCADPSIV